MITNIHNLFFAPLFKQAQKVRVLSSSEEEEVIAIANHFLLSGFLLNSCIFDKANIRLIDQLKIQRKVASFKYITMKRDLFKISEYFESRDIEFLVLKGMAMNLQGIFKPGVRQMRDLDLIIRQDRIPEAYAALRELGFKYDNNETSDTAVIFTKHHLPVMTNEHGTKIELHWRITAKRFFEKCPLVDPFFKNKQPCGKYKNIYYPNYEGLMAHTIYHGVKHHKIEHGIIFLFDIFALKSHHGDKWPTDYDLIKSIGLNDTLSSYKSFFKRKKVEDIVSADNLKIDAALLEDFSWVIDEDANINLLGIYGKRYPLKSIVKRFTSKFSYTSHNYQVPVGSTKYWFFYLRDMLRVAKKIRF